MHIFNGTLIWFQSIWNFYGGALHGPTDTGKTETVKGLAYLLGRYLVTLSCSPRMAASGIGKIIVGLAEVSRSFFVCMFLS